VVDLDAVADLDAVEGFEALMDLDSVAGLDPVPDRDDADADLTLVRADGFDAPRASVLVPPEVRAGAAPDPPPAPTRRSGVRGARLDDWLDDWPDDPLEDCRDPGTSRSLRALPPVRSVLAGRRRSSLFT
jgi:hypothetical protein